MRISFLITSRNEGHNLVNTVRSLSDVSRSLEHEFVIVDDGSTDDSVEVLRREFSDAIVIRHEDSLGVSPSRAVAASAATGDVFIFVDAHVAFTPGSVERLVTGIERTRRNAVLVPKVTQFNTETWTADPNLRGFGFELSLDKCEGRWLELSEMISELVDGHVYYRSPTVVGCSVAVHRDAYFHIGGFDPMMRTWGMEDVDFGIRAWMMGHPVLCDPNAEVGHRFVTRFEAYESKMLDFAANQIRMAKKLFGSESLSEWMNLRGLGNSDDVEYDPMWVAAFESCATDPVEASRLADDFRSSRVRDEFSYAELFQLPWPRRDQSALNYSPTKMP